MQGESPDWSIGRLAEVSGLAVKTIRFYSDAGLLPSRRTAAGHRRYAPADLPRLQLIREAVDRGCGRLEWWVLRTNDPALRFYRRLRARGLDEMEVMRLEGHPLEDLAASQADAAQVE